MAECKGQVSETINASPEKVWEYVGDLARHTEWNHQPQKIELISGVPGSVGATYRTQETKPAGAPLPVKIMMTVVIRPMMWLYGATWQTEATVTELDPPRRIAWQARAPKRKGDMMRAKWVVALQPEGASTRVTQDFEFMPQTRFPGAPPAKFIAEEVGRNLKTLKALAEQSA